MRAIKGNRVYSINETVKDHYQKQGFDIYDDAGALIAHGKGKTVPLEKYLAVVAELEALKAKKTTRKKAEEGDN